MPASGHRTHAQATQASRFPKIRLAHNHRGQGQNVLMGIKGVQRIPHERAPSLLVSFVYLKPFLAAQHQYAYRDWALDSGAFSAYNSGQTIELQEYINVCKRLRHSDKTMSEIFALDVIGDWRASLANVDEMERQGAHAIPTYHYDDNDWGVLVEMASRYDKIAIGGMATLRGGKKSRFVEQVFAHVWPKKVHGFGCASVELLNNFPWHTVDATTWEYGPAKFGRWRSFGDLSIRGSHQNLRAEVEHYMKMEREAQSRWVHEMRMLEGLRHEDVPRKLPAGGEHHPGDHPARGPGADPAGDLGLP